MIRAAPMPQRLFIGLFLFLAAVVIAVAPAPTVFRSAGVALCAYLAFAGAGMPAAYLTALIAPPLGLVQGTGDWLVMLPIVLAGNLLAMLGLEFAWRLPAVAVSPLLLVAPAFVAWQLSTQELFEVSLPWSVPERTWVLLHLLVGVAGVLLALLVDRRRATRT
ncbi:MAG TPA: hypothetical protein VF202_00410 [Trueperaceae bacterium]